MNEVSLRKIESLLGVLLPNDYRRFLKRPRHCEEIDDQTVLRDAEAIIGWTLKYRNGFAGLEPWPVTLIYIGDEADACPYALDCANGTVRRTDKGRLDREPLGQWNSFDDFVSCLAREYHEGPSPEEHRRDAIRFRIAVFIFLILLVFVPAMLAAGMVSVFKWLYHWLGK